MPIALTSASYNTFEDMLKQGRGVQTFHRPEGTPPPPKWKERAQHAAEELQLTGTVLGTCSSKQIAPRAAGDTTNDPLSVSEPTN